MSLKPGYLQYLQGDTVDKLDDAYKFDGSTHGNAYAESLQDAINTYCTLFDKAAPLVAHFLRSLPFIEGNEHQNALMGLHILRETRRALDEVLHNDAELRQSVVGDNRTSAETDEEIAKSAGSFDKHYDLDTKEKLGREAGREIRRDEQNVNDSFYDGEKGQDVEGDVAKSARNTLDGLGSISIPTVQNDHKEEAKKPVETQATKTEEKQKKRLIKPITIEIPDFKGNDPIIVFRQATEWLIQQIILVSSGSMAPDEFPRIDVLFDLPDEPLATSKTEVTHLANYLRSNVRRLRPPMGEGPRDLHDLRERYRLLDPEDRLGMRDMLSDMLGRFGEMTDRLKEKEYESRYDETSWKDGDGDAWKNNGDD